MVRKTEKTQLILDQVARFKDVMQAWVDGKPIQFNCGNGWKDFPETSEPMWLLGADYRIQPKTPLQIPWSFIDRKYTWAAKNKSGSICVFTDRPTIPYGCTFWSVNSLDKIIPLVNIDPDDIPWVESLVKRPVDVPQVEE